MSESNKRDPINQIPKLALVTSWFGQELKGGAEQQAWQIATRLNNKYAKVTVLTTCAKSFHANWSINHYRPGPSMEAGVPIKRFKVKQQKQQKQRKFAKIAKKLIYYPMETLLPGISPLNKTEEDVYLQENIHSPDLITYLQENQQHYDAFLFIPYLFPLSLHGVLAVKEKAILQPCLHDESYAYLHCVQAMIYDSAQIFFNSRGEQEIAYRLFGQSIARKSHIVGEGIEVTQTRLEASMDRVVEGDYVLYLGKRCTEKNTHLLITYFDQFVSNQDTSLKLVIAGSGTLPIMPQTKNVVDLGLVSENDKINLLKHCRALVNPSINESFSRIIFEAWFAKRPVIVHQHCLATYQALEDSQAAGFSFFDQATFHQALTALLDPQFDSHTVGEKGYTYAQQIANWDNVCAKYHTLLVQMQQRNHAIAQFNHTHPIVILAETVVKNDAVGNDVIAQIQYFRRLGSTCFLYAKTCSSEYRKYLPPSTQWAALLNNPQAIFIFHHSTYWEAALDIVEKAQGRLFLRYHNVTPPQYFAPYAKAYHTATSQGQALTANLIASKKFSYYLPNSPYSGEDLIQLGAPADAMTPLAPFHKIADFDALPLNPTLLKKLDNRCINLLFVGRTAPNKGHHHLIHIVDAYVKRYGPAIKLHIVGSIDSNLSTYLNQLKTLIWEKQLEQQIEFHQMISFNDLHTYFKACDVFLMMSEHEGFCVPILEAQYHRLPILALDKSASADTAGPQQLVRKNPDYSFFACAIALIAGNPDIRRFLTDQGFANYQKYQKHHLGSQLLDLVMDQAPDG